MLLSLDDKILESECTVRLGGLRLCCKAVGEGRATCFRGLLPNVHKAVIYGMQPITGDNVRFKLDF